MLFLLFVLPCNAMLFFFACYSAIQWFLPSMLHTMQHDVLLFAWFNAMQCFLLACYTATQRLFSLLVTIQCNGFSHLFFLRRNECFVLCLPHYNGFLLCWFLLFSFLSFPPSCMLQCHVLYYNGFFSACYNAMHCFSSVLPTNCIFLLFVLHTMKCFLFCLLQCHAMLFLCAHYNLMQRLSSLLAEMQ